ncbi:drug efflux system protein MdtG [Escherichia coli]|uniref:Drug efflux system protein MdtG n=1 Tax=Escherichia coli TaxID=562 RepID=A0A376TIG5_ECOLX|nr:drug efflux system protein MdtG [Escherichia coli]
MREVVTSLKNPKLVLSLFVTTLIIQVATGSIAPHSDAVCPRTGG